MIIEHDRLFLGVAIGLIVGAVVFLIMHFAFPTSCPVPEIVNEAAIIITDFCYAVTGGVDDFAACLVEYGIGN